MQQKLNMAACKFRNQIQKWTSWASYPCCYWYIHYIHCNIIVVLLNQTPEHTPPEWATCQNSCPEKWYTTGCPKKKGDPCLRAIEGTRIGLKTKLGRVLENSGNFLSNEHKNSPILWKNSWENWGQTWLPPLENMALSEVTLQINPLPFMKFWSQMRKKRITNAILYQ